MSRWGSFTITAKPGEVTVQHTSGTEKNLKIGTIGNNADISAQNSKHGGSGSPQKLNAEVDEIGDETKFSFQNDE